MTDLVESGRVVDLILVFVVIEALALVAYRRITRRGLRLPGILLMLLPGVCLLLALRGALVGAAPWVVLAWLAAALVAHLLDLWVRWRYR
jgi:hypothetical protein